LEKDLSKYCPQEKASSKGKKGKGKVGKASSSSPSTAPPPLSMEEMHSKVGFQIYFLNVLSIGPFTWYQVPRGTHF
jgi:hypothetical protein